MTQLELFKKEMVAESAATRKMLSKIPNDRYDWKPHPKSMSMKQLAAHIAELPTWIGMVLNTDHLDFAANPYKPEDISDTPTLLDFFEKQLKDGIAELTNGKEETLSQPWTLRNGEQVYSTDPKADVIRMTLSQIIHHRAQLGVFLRLLDVPIPGTYGPSADEDF